MHMKFPLLLVAALLFVTSCSKNDVSKPAADPCAVTSSARNGQVIEGQYIIAYRATTGIASTAAGSRARMTTDVLQRNGIASTALKQSFEGAAAGFVARLSDDEVQALRKDPAIEMIEPDRIIALSTCWEVVEPKLITWNVNKTGYGDGTGKTAWVIDTGIDFVHPDLNVDVTPSRSFVSGQTSAADEHGHGTHVAGIIGAKNNNFGILGVASNATLVSLRVLNKDGEGTVSAMIQALAYINANAKAGDVVNMSLGEEGISEILDQHVLQTAAKGIYISIAAGNDGKPAVQFSPGRVNGANIYTVSAVDSLNQFASFSNYGNDVVDFAAPGVRILSTYTEGRYARMSGTSMAAPHVAGLLLLKGRNIRSSGSALNDPDGAADPIAAK